jgi:hypothetical protein
MIYIPDHARCLGSRTSINVPCVDSWDEGLSEVGPDTTSTKDITCWPSLFEKHSLLYAYCLEINNCCFSVDDAASQLFSHDKHKTSRFVLVILFRYHI